MWCGRGPVGWDEWAELSTASLASSSSAPTASHPIKRRATRSPELTVVRSRGRLVLWRPRPGGPAAAGAARPALVVGAASRRKKREKPTDASSTSGLGHCWVSRRSPLPFACLSIVAGVGDIDRMRTRLHTIQNWVFGMGPLEKQPLLFGWNLKGFDAGGTSHHPCSLAHSSRAAGKKRRPLSRNVEERCCPWVVDPLIIWGFEGGPPRPPVCNRERKSHQGVRRLRVSACISFRGVC